MYNIMKELAMNQISMYAECIVRLCKDNPENATFYKEYYDGKVDGVIDMLSADPELSSREYVELSQKLKAYFKVVVERALALK